MAETRRRFSTQGLKLLTEFKQLDEAAQRKFIRYTLSGVVIVVLGLVLIFVGIQFGSAASSVEVLLIGLGAIIVIVGIIRVLIGFITPRSPTELDESSEQETAKELDEELFRE